MAKSRVLKSLAEIRVNAELSIGERIMILHHRIKQAGRGGVHEVLGIHRVTLSHWTNDKRLPTATEQEKLIAMGGELLTSDHFLAAHSGTRRTTKKPEKATAKTSAKIDVAEDGFDW